MRCTGQTESENGIGKVMSMSKRWTLALCLIAAIGSSAAAPPPAPLKTLPAARVVDPAGRRHLLSELLGEGPTLLVFWNTPCRSCLAKLHGLERFALDRQESGLSLLMINTDPPRSMKQARPFLRRHGFEAPTYFDNNEEAFRKLGGRSAPFVVLVGVDGRILFESLTYKSRDLQVIDDLIGSPADEREPTGSGDGESTGAGTGQRNQD